MRWPKTVTLTSSKRVEVICLLNSHVQLVLASSIYLFIAILLYALVRRLFSKFGLLFGGWTTHHTTVAAPASAVSMIDHRRADAVGIC